MARQITPIQLPAGSVIPGDIALPDGQVLVGNSSGNAAARAMSGDVTISDTGVTTLASTAAALMPFSGKNRIINGDFSIDQYNNGASVTLAASAYPIDRWRVVATQANKVSFQKNAGAITPPAGFSTYGGLTSLTAYTVLATDQFYIFQRIEGFNCADLGFGTAAARNVTLSFWAYSSLTGTFGGSIRNADLTRSYPFTYAISAANIWTQVSITIPGDTAGTWLTDSNAGLIVTIGLGSGANTSGPAGAWAGTSYSNVTGAVSVVGTSGATLYMTTIQLESGSIATPFEVLPFALKLVQCQRFFCKTFPLATAPAQSAGVVGAITVKNPIALGDPSEWWQFPVAMRVTPTIVTYNPSASNANWRDVTASADATVSVDPVSSAGQGGVLITTSGTVTTLGDILCIHATASAEY